MGNRNALSRLNDFEERNDHELLLGRIRGSRRRERWLSDNGMLWASQPIRRKEHGNLVGLALVLGLLAFFLADGLPWGLNPVTAFLIAAAVVLALFLVGALVWLILERRRSAVESAAPRRGRQPAPLAETRSWSAGLDTEPSSTARIDDWSVEARLQVEDVLVAADRLPSAEERKVIYAALLTFLTAAPDDSRADAWSALDEIGRRFGLEYEVSSLGRLPGSASRVLYDVLLEDVRRRMSRR